MNASRRRKPLRLAEASGDTPHYHGHRERLRQRLIAAGAEQSARLRADRSDPLRQQPARRCEAVGQGSAPTVWWLRRVAQRRCRGARRRRARSCRDRRAQIGARGRTSADAVGTASAAGSRVVGQAHRLLHGAHRAWHGRGVPYPFPRPQKCADQARAAAARDDRPHAGLSARGGQARTRAPGLGADPGAQSSVGRPDPVQGGHRRHQGHRQGRRRRSA